MRYLVVEAHPDDMVFFCGGTVARLIEQGHEIYVLTLTDGQQGTLNPKYDTAKKLADTMRAEHAQACEYLGVKEVKFIGLMNHFLENTHELREVIVRHVREIQPGAVFTLDPWNQDENPDHRAVGMATLEACSFSHMHLFHPEHLDEGLKTAMVAKVILYKTDQPNSYYDIADTLSRKVEAAMAYESQIELMRDEGVERLKVLGKSHPLFEGDFAQIVGGGVQGMAAEAGGKAGLEAAEAFHVRGLGILENIKELIGGLDVE